MKIRLLGQFSVALDNIPITNFASDKVRALFAYLVTEAQCPHRREILANLLWSDQPDETSRANLRRALSDLRKCIGDHNANPPYLLISRQDIQFNSESQVWADIATLDDLYQQKTISPANEHSFQRMIDLYQGEFLEGFSIADSLYFNEWVLITREQQHRKMVSLLDRVAGYYEEQQAFEKSLPFSWRLFELDPWQEKARRQLMRLLAQTGRRHEALNQYKMLADQLEEELDVAPETQTTALYRLIKAGKQPAIQDSVSREPSAQMQTADELNIRSQEIFVSREEELAKLHQILEGTLAGTNGLVFISGEAGSGKSMLVQEFIRQVQARYTEIVSAVGFCNPFSGVGDPYLPFREILSQLCGSAEHTLSRGYGSQPFANRLWKIKPDVLQAITQYGDNLLNTLISSQSLLNLTGPLEDSHPDLVTGLNDLIERKENQAGGIPSQPNIFTQFTAVLKEVAREHPLILALDDLQWADTGSIGMLFHLGKHLTSSRIMLVGAYRSEEVSTTREGERHLLAPVLSELQRDIGEITIRLDRSEDKAFVDDFLASEPNDLDENFHDLLLRHTNGHPLFTVELLRDLQESGTLVRDGKGRWVVKQDFQIEKLPPKIEGIIGERIGRLPSILQHILAAASVEGETFTAEVVAEVEGLPVHQVINLFSRQLDKQHRLVRAQQIKMDEEKTNSIYKFRHILFQKYLYDQLDAIERTNYHARVGMALEALVGEDNESHAILLARHFDEANQVEKAIHYYQMAGQGAFGMSGHLEAISHFEKALKLVISQPGSSQRDQRELGLQLQTGLAYQAVEGYASENVGRAFERAWELSKKVENPGLAKQACQLLYSYYSNIAEFETAKEIFDIFQQYVDKSTALGNLEFHWGRGYLDLCLGNLESAYASFTKALSYYSMAEAQSIFQAVGMEAGILGNGHGAILAANVGYPEHVKEHIRTIMSIAEVWRENGVVQTDAMWYIAWAYLELGDYDPAGQYLEKAMRLAEKHHIMWITSFIKLFQGRLLSKKGKYEEALACIEEGLQIFNMVGFVTFKSFFFQGLAEVHCAAGSISEGLGIVHEAEIFADETGEHRFSSPIQRIKGDLLLSEDEKAAEEAYQNAIAIARKQGAKMLELQAAICLARLWQAQGNVEQSTALLQPIYAWFTEGFDTPWLVEAKAMLGEFSIEG